MGVSICLTYKDRFERSEHMKEKRAFSGFTFLNYYLGNFLRINIPSEYIYTILQQNFQIKKCSVKIFLLERVHIKLEQIYRFNFLFVSDSNSIQDA